MSQRLKLGTRRSLLAWAQSSWVAQCLEKLNPGLKIELVGIETRGDRIQDVPLSSVEGKEFFVAELDHALARGEVDLTVHSMKDLSLSRPSGFICAAIPQRENPRDVILFCPDVLEKISSGRPLRIGTSSPRRLENIAPFLSDALPFGARIEMVEIRGNVNTRLGRIHLGPESPKQLDAVVLAFAGLIRLWADSTGRAELTGLLRGVRWMILPLRECPAAPAQGALAIECRSEDRAAREVIGKLHHPSTAQQVGQERKLLEEWGGGCHQKFGATAIEVKGLGGLLFVRGKKSNEEVVNELRWRSPLFLRAKRNARDVVAWDGVFWRKKDDLSSAKREVPLEKNTSVFVAHSRAAAPIESGVLNECRVWTSGVSSWYALARRGVWVEGCAESLGFDSLSSTLTEGVLRQPPSSGWTILTHENAVDGWKHLEGARILSTYDVDARYSAEARAALKNSTHIYWSSFSQWQSLKQESPVGAIHATGPGKTARLLKERGLEPLIFPGVEEWRKWISTQE